MRFADFEFDVATAELRRAGRPVALERQPALTLALLVARAGRLVPRDELRRAVWASDVHVDFDRGLNYCIRQLRTALTDNARSPRFIETIPRQGYRFIAPVAAGVALAASSPGPKSRLRRRGLAAAAAILFVAGLGWDRASHDPERSARHHAAAVSTLQALHDLVF